jgi:hypothetical protein
MLTEATDAIAPWLRRTDLLARGTPYNLMLHAKYGPNVQQCDHRSQRPRQKIQRSVALLDGAMEGLKFSFLSLKDHRNSP